MTSTTTDRRRGVHSGQAIKLACICATTANITLSGEQTIDGITTDGTRILVKDQTDATENGIYKTGTSAWTREPDFNGTYDVSEGTIVPVSRGTVNAATLWRVSNTGAITIDTTELSFTAQAVDAAALLSDGSVSMAADFLPATDASHDLGSTTYRFASAYFSSAVTMNSATVSSNITVSGAATLSSAATISGAASMSSAATVTGTATLSSKVIATLLTTTLSGSDPGVEGQLWTSSGYVLVSTG